MHIAITGGSGRVGRGITELALEQGHTVVSIDRVETAEEKRLPNVTYIQADLTNYDAFEAAIKGCDTLVHMAAIPSPGHHPDHVVHNNNVTSSYNALLAAATLGISHVCQASSINATGAAYSRWPRYDYFPLDELHPTYNEDPYSLSKWICELQGDSFARRYENMTISSMRFHWVVDDISITQRLYKDAQFEIMAAKNLWAYTQLRAAARACLLALTASFTGHEAFYIVAPHTTVEVPSLEMAQRYFPETAIRGDMSGHRSFYDSSKAERLLGWKHDLPETHE